MLATGDHHLDAGRQQGGRVEHDLQPLVRSEEAEAQGDELVRMETQRTPGRVAVAGGTHLDPQRDDRRTGDRPPERLLVHDDARARTADRRLHRGQPAPGHDGGRTDAVQPRVTAIHLGRVDDLVHRRHQRHTAPVVQRHERGEQTWQRRRAAIEEQLPLQVHQSRLQRPRRSPQRSAAPSHPGRTPDARRRDRRRSGPDHSPTAPPRPPRGDRGRRARAPAMRCTAPHHCGHRDGSPRGG